MNDQYFLIGPYSLRLDRTLGIERGEYIADNGLYGTLWKLDHGNIVKLPYPLYDIEFDYACQTGWVPTALLDESQRLKFSYVSAAALNELPIGWYIIQITDGRIGFMGVPEDMLVAVQVYIDGDHRRMVRGAKCPSLLSYTFKSIAGPYYGPFGHIGCGWGITSVMKGTGQL